MNFKLFCLTIEQNYCKKMKAFKVVKQTVAILDRVVRVSVLTATDDCGCVGGVRQLDPRDYGACREPLQVRWPVQTRAWTQVPQKSTYVDPT